MIVFRTSRQMLIVTNSHVTEAHVCCNAQTARLPRAKDTVWQG